MFTDAELSLNFRPVSREPELVIIPIDAENGIVAVVKGYGLGQASCIAFYPTTKLVEPLKNYRPQFLRKTVTTDFQLRMGAWPALSIDTQNAASLRSAVTVLMTDIEKMDPEKIRTIDMTAPSNRSSAPDHCIPTYRADEGTAFEAALRHLLGVDSSDMAGSMTSSTTGEELAP